MNSPKRFNIIIAGAGAAGLSLAFHLSKDVYFSKKKILVIDKEDKIANDRTWCFWEKNNGLFQDCVEKEWNHLKFSSYAFKNILSTTPYRYKMIQSNKFYHYCWNTINQTNNISSIKTKITAINNSLVYTEDGVFEGEYIFNSALFEISKIPHKHHLLQHFKGWYVKFASEVFDPQIATLMDFDIAQHGDCRFVYVLPTSSSQALIEYTVFSKALLEAGEYETALHDYINKHFPNQEFEIEHSEFGIIPMTNAKINAFAEEGKIFAIGTAGYATKASSGYTFSFIQRQCRIVVEGLKQNQLKQSDLMPSKKFQLYDAVLLHILAYNHVPAWKVFAQLFEELPTALVLKFLNEESGFLEDIRIMWSTDKLKFSKAAFKEITGFL